LDLLKRLKQLGCKLFVTRRMLNEAWDHLQWAARFTRNHTPLSPTFLAAALSGPGYEQNFFLDGFICLAADGIVTTAEDYLHLICGKRVIESQFGKCVSELGITITDLQLVQGYSSDDEEEVEHLAADIKRDRVLRSTFRSEEQVEAEAEVLALIHGLRSKKYEFGLANVERVYFISNSLVLDRISEEGDVITWTPESAYRYLASLPSTPPPVELLHECLLHSYYDAGVTAIDSGRYRRFFSSYINAANLSLKQEKERYFKVTEETYHTDIEKVFRTTPDLEKPLFVNKIGWQILEISENAAKEARSKAVAAEKQVKSLLEEKRMGWRKSGKARVRQLAAETKNQADSKHVRKRARQKRARDSGKRHGK
jgi:hypothetical protein